MFSGRSFSCVGKSSKRRESRAVERFSPAKLDDILGSANQAVILLGPRNAGGWLVADAAAALVPLLTRFRQPGPTATGLLITQALALFGIAVAVGPRAVRVAFVLIAGMNGALNPIHQGCCTGQSTTRRVGPP